MSNHEDWRSCNLVSILLAVPAVGIDQCSWLTWFFLVCHSLSTYHLVHPMAWTSDLPRAFPGGQLVPLWWASQATWFQLSILVNYELTEILKYSRSELPLTVHDTSLSSGWGRATWKWTPPWAPKQLVAHEPSSLCIQLSSLKGPSLLRLNPSFTSSQNFPWKTPPIQPKDLLFLFPIS